MGLATLVCHIWLDFVAAFFGVDVDGLDLVADLHGEAQTLFGDAGPAVDGDDDEGRIEVVEADGAVDGDIAGDAAVVAFDGDHQDDECGDEDCGDPCAVGELGDEDDERVMPVATAPMPLTIMRRMERRAACSFPMHDHAGLGEGEGEEGADGEEWDEAIGDSSEDDEQERGEA